MNFFLTVTQLSLSFVRVADSSICEMGEETREDQNDGLLITDDEKKLAKRLFYAGIV